MIIDTFPHEAFVGAPIEQARGVALLRLTAYATLACFLRLQFACCCAAHGASSVERESVRSECCSDSVAEQNASEHTTSFCGEHSAHDHGVEAGKSQRHHHDCHLCVISHLRFVPAKYPPQPIGMNVAATDTTIIVTSIATPQFDARVVLGLGVNSR